MSTFQPEQLSVTPAREGSGLNLKRFTTGFLLLAFALHASWLAFRWGGASAQPLLAGGLYVPVFLASAACCLLAARGLKGRERRSWLGFSLGTLAFGVGQVIYTVLQASLHVSPFPSLADLLFLTFPVCVGLGLAGLPHLRLSRLGWLQLVLDVGIMTGAALTFSWKYVLTGLLRAYADQPLAGSIALAYPASDLVLLCLLLILVSRRTALTSRVTALIALALAAFIVADTGFAQLGATGSYLPGNPVDLFWSLGGLLFGMAATVRLDREAPAVADAAQGPLRGWVALGPYVAVVLTFGLLIQTLYRQAGTGALDRGVMWCTALVTLLVMVRQAVAHLENLALSRALSRAATTLEAQVAARTEELHLTNRQLQTLAEELESRVLARTSELASMQAQLVHQAHHDALTGLPNRKLFDDRLGQALASARRHDRRVAVLCIDLDGFKQVNDTLGHAAGDEVLQTVAARLLALVRSSDTVARLGGDEFAVLLAEYRDAASGTGNAEGHHTEVHNTESYIVESYVEGVARRVLETVGRAIRIGAHSASVSASVGAAVYPEDALDLVTLKLRADAAMYRAKQNGKGQVCYSHGPEHVPDLGAPA